MKPTMHLLVLAVSVATLVPVSSSVGAGKYVLAFWRELGAYENQAPPAGSFGNHSAFIHVWDEHGQPLAGKQLLNAYGTLVAVTQPTGYEEYAFPQGSGYTFRVRDGAHLSDTSPAFSTQRPPNWGHYSMELGFVFKAEANSPGTFDTSYVGTLNAQGDQPCANLSAPATRSLAFNATLPTDYCSDPHGLGNWAAFHGQTFVATGNRIVAMKAFMAAGFNVHHYWTVQILAGGPTGPPVGPPRSSRLHLDQEYVQILITWGLNDVQVVPGRTYFMKVTRPGGLNAFRTDRNNYAAGSYHEAGTSMPGAELMGLVVCANVTNSGPTGTLTGTVRDPQGMPQSGAEVCLPALGLYGISDANGSYALTAAPVGTHLVTAARPDFFSTTNSSLVIGTGTTTADFTLAPDPNYTGGILTNGSYILYPFELAPAWNSAFDTAWGGAADFAPMKGGVASKALQGYRGGQGSSARVLVFGIWPGTTYQIGIWAKCPAAASDYWAECAFKLGHQTAEDFDANGNSWTGLRNFSDDGPNGNGNVWTRYTMNFNSGTNTQLSVGFKLGAIPGVGPLVYWDQLELVSLALPTPRYAVADSPTNVLVGFGTTVSAATATNVNNYQLTNAAGHLGITSATLASPTSVRLTTAVQPPRSDMFLTVSNVLDPLQPAFLTGANGHLRVRVPWALVPLDATTRWKYEASGAAPSALWKFFAFNDAAWADGAAPFGYAPAPLPVPLRTGLDPNSNRITAYFRHRFNLPADLTDAYLRLRPLVDDGALVWLNQREVLRLGLTNPTVTSTTLAARTVGLADFEGPFVLTDPGLFAGTNLLAVEVHQADPADLDVVFGLEVEALLAPSQVPMPPPALDLIHDAGTLTIGWAGDGWTLEGSTNVLGPWHELANAPNPASLDLTNTTMFFRLRQTGNDE